MAARSGGVVRSIPSSFNQDIEIYEVRRLGMAARVPAADRHLGVIGTAVLASTALADAAQMIETAEASATDARPRQRRNSITAYTGTFTRAMLVALPFVLYPWNRRYWRCPVVDKRRAGACQTGSRCSCRRGVRLSGARKPGSAACWACRSCLLPCCRISGSMPSRLSVHAGGDVADGGAAHAANAHRRMPILYCVLMVLFVKVLYVGLPTGTMSIRSTHSETGS